MLPSFRLADLALRVDELLMRPENMAAARQLVESYRKGREQGVVEAIPFPNNPDEVTDEGIDADAVPTPEQGAAALVALRDAYCPGVEKIISVPCELPADAPDVETLRREWSRGLTWRATLVRVRDLGDYAVPWFTLQLRRFEQSLLTACSSQPQAPAPAVQFTALTPLAPSGTSGGEEPDGPFGTDGFRYRGIEVRFGRAAKQLNLVLALWDTTNRRPRPPRIIEDVMTDVYGEEHETSDPTFRQLCTDTRRRLDTAHLHLKLTNSQGKVCLEAQPA